MSLIALPDFEDEVLSQSVMQQADIEAAEDFISDLALQFNTTYEGIKTDPLPRKVKEIMLAVAYIRRARIKAGTQPAANRGPDGKDAYEKKLGLYQREFDRLLGEMSYAVLTGQEVAAGIKRSGPIQLSRG